MALDWPYESANLSWLGMVGNDSLKYYRDFKSVTDIVKDEGLQKGIEIGKETGKAQWVLNKPNV